MQKGGIRCWRTMGYLLKATHGSQVDQREVIKCYAAFYTSFPTSEGGIADLESVFEMEIKIWKIEV